MKVLSYLLFAPFLQQSLGLSSPTSSPTQTPFYMNYDGVEGNEDGKASQCTVDDGTGAVFSIDNPSGDPLAKFQLDVVIDDSGIDIGEMDLCISSTFLEAPDEEYSIDEKLYDPLYRTDAPSDSPSVVASVAPSAAPFYMNYDGPEGKDDGKNSMCTVKDNIGSIFSVENSKGNSVAEYQFDVEIGESVVNIGSMDLCLASKLAEESAGEDDYSIAQKLYDPLFGSFSPSSQPSYLPTMAPTDAPSGSPTTNPTSSPTDSPSNNPSASPSISPSDLPTTVAQAANWNIYYVEKSAGLVSDNTKLTIKYDVSPVRITQPDLKLTFLKSSCDMDDQVENTVFKTTDAEYFQNEDGIVTLVLDLDESNIAESGFWEDDTEKGSGLGLCLRTDLTDSTDVDLAGFPLAKHESTFWLGYDLEAGFTTVVDEVNDMDADAADDAQTSFTLGACLCENEACTKNALALNQDFELCVYSIEERMMIENINSVFMKQDGTMKFQPIKEGKPNVVSYIRPDKKFTMDDGSVKNGVIVGSKAVPVFFDGPLIDGKLPPIELSGTAKLKFDELYESSKRLLAQQARSAGGSEAVAKAEDGEEGEDKFELTVPLSTAGLDKLVEAETKPEGKKHLYWIAALSVVAIIALIVVARRKKKD